MEPTTDEVTATFTAAGRQALLDWMLGLSAVTPPANVWLALCSGMPTDDDSSDSFPEVPPSWSDEEGGVLTTGYFRVSYPFGELVLSDDQDENPAWNTLGYATYANGWEVVFPEAVDDWPPVMAWAMLDAETGGTVLAYGPVTLDVYAGDQVIIPEGGLSLSAVPLEA